jgi:hypothetical protein
MASRKLVGTVMEYLRAHQIARKAGLYPIKLILTCIRGPPVIIFLVPEERVDHATGPKARNIILGL